MRKLLFIAVTALLSLSVAQGWAQTTQTVEQVLGSADALIGKKVNIEGLCTHICSHGGKKIFMAGKSPKTTLRIEAGKSVGSFPKEVVNAKVSVTGTLVEERIDEAYLKNWEAQVKAQEAKEKSSAKHEEGCSADQQAQGEKIGASTQERIADFRKRIAERNQKESKNYLSFYYIEADSYKVK